MTMIYSRFRVVFGLSFFYGPVWKLQKLVHIGNVPFFWRTVYSSSNRTVIECIAEDLALPPKYYP